MNGKDHTIYIHKVRSSLGCYLTQASEEKKPSSRQVASSWDFWSDEKSRISQRYEDFSKKRNQHSRRIITFSIFQWCHHRIKITNEGKTLNLTTIPWRFPTSKYWIWSVRITCIVLRAVLEWRYRMSLSNTWKVAVQQLQIASIIRMLFKSLDEPCEARNPNEVHWNLEQVLLPAVIASKISRGSGLLSYAR